MRRNYTALSYGSGVQAILRGRGHWRIDAPHSEVVAVFRRSCYARVDDSSIMCIAHRNIEDGPLTMRVAFPSRCDMADLGIRVGARVRSENGDLLLGDDVLLRTSSAALWRPPVIDKRASRNIILTRLGQLESFVAGNAPYDGLARLGRDAEPLANGGPVDSAKDSQLVNLALPALTSLVCGTWEREANGIEAGVKGLIGLGPGLTPSGDDLLAGFVVALSVLACTSKLEEHHRRLMYLDGRVRSVRGSISRHAEEGTTEISAALLSQAAKGAASSSVHSLVRAIVAPVGDDVLGAATALVNHGHTSGWDCLAGILLGTHLGLRIERAVRIA